MTEMFAHFFRTLFGMNESGQRRQYQSTSDGSVHFQAGGGVTLDLGGKVYSGKDIRIKHGRITVDGDAQEGEFTSPILEVRVLEGEITTLTTTASVTCGTVKGNIDAGGSVTCKAVGGSVDAGGSVTCNDVGGSIDAGGSVKCGKVSGDIDAGGSVRHG
jgi:hypothetical protein